LPVYIERTILELPSIFINGGNRGFLIRVAPQVLTNFLNSEPVACAARE